MARLTNVKVSLKLPYIGEVAGTWKPDEYKRRAAWAMSVELVTCISGVPLPPGEGLLREALSSLHDLFEITRNILRSYGPTIAQPHHPDKLSFSYLAVLILNRVLRPILAKWYPLLLDYESHKPGGTSIVKWERQCERTQELRQVLDDVHRALSAYTNLLAEAAEVPSLIDDDCHRPNKMCSSIEGTPHDEGGTCRMTAARVDSPKPEVCSVP